MVRFIKLIYYIIRETFLAPTKTSYIIFKDGKIEIIRV